MLKGALLWGNVFYIKTISRGVHRNKLWLYLALGVLVFAYSCKQANNTEEQNQNNPTKSNEITIIVKGDEG